MNNTEKEEECKGNPFKHKVAFSAKLIQEFNLKLLFPNILIASRVTNYSAINP